MSKIIVTKLPNGDQWFPLNVDGRSIRVQIFKERSPYFTARFEHAGKPYLRTSGTNVPAVASKILREKIREVFAGRAEATKTRHEGATVAEVVKRYQDLAVSSRQVQPDTARANWTAFLRILKAGLAPTAKPGNLRLRDIDGKASFAAYVRHLEARAQKAKADGDPWAEKRVPITANAALRMARSLFTPAALRYYDGLVLPDKLPLSDCQLIPGSPDVSYDPGIWTDLEGMKKSLNEMRYTAPEKWLAIALAANLGLRRKELTSMRWDWIERTQAGSCVAIIERADYKPKRGGRRVAVSPGLLAQLEEFRGKSSQEYLLGATPTDRRNVLVAASKWVKSWQRPGARSMKTMHELRKHFGSVLLEKHGLERAAEALGHAPGSVVTRKHYATFLSATPAVEVL